MDRNGFFKAMEEHLTSFKEKVRLNDGSGVAALAESARKSLAAMKNAVMDSDKGKAVADTAHDYLHKLEQAAKNGDRKLTEKLVGLLETAVTDLRARLDDKDGKNGGEPGPEKREDEK